MQKVVLVLALALCTLFAYAADIVTMPTANQLHQGEVELSAYYLMLEDMPGPAPHHVSYQTLYAGLTDRIELDVHRADVQNDKTSVVLVGSVKVLNETKTLPDVVVGVRNFTNTQATNNPALAGDSKKASYFVSTAKTFFFNPEKPGPPLMRAHLSYGTADYTLLGERRHDGFFGGGQFLITPQIGAVAQYDGADLITALTYMPAAVPGLTLKAGTFARHKWVGVSYMKDLF